MKQRIRRLPAKLRGELPAEPPCSLARYACWSFISGTLGILAVGAIARASGQPLLIGSFGASAMLLFGATTSPFAQPRNLIGGHLVSATVAVTMASLFGPGLVTAAVAVGLAIMLMNLTRTEHPPGGATALIAVQGHAGPVFIIIPVLAGILVLLLVALFTNNLVYPRRYPERWW
jgi:CBS-domain-containing membrane protein